MLFDLIDFQYYLENMDKYYLLVTGVFTIIYQLSFFAVAFNYKFDKVTDFAGGTNFVILALLSYFLSKPEDPRAMLATLCIAAWGARLSGFLLYRILKTEEDNRFDDLRGDFFKFLGFWVFQMVWVWTCSLPITVVNAAGNSVFAPDFGLFSDYLGLLMFIVGIVVETISDAQKFEFRESKPKSLDIIQNGLWKYSRHPNYFGEILLWWGIYLLCLPITSQLGVYTVASPMFISWLLMFVSGIPLTDPKREKKFMDEGAHGVYLEYFNKTSPLIPLPNDFYASLPELAKSSFFFEFPSYRAPEDIFKKNE